MSERDAYFAGLFDGEGCVYVTKHDTRLQLYVKLKMTCEDTVRGFADYAGCGCFTNEPPGKPHHKPQFRIKIQGVQAMEVLERLAPYLRTKAADARDCIARYRAQPPPRFGRNVRHRALFTSPEG